MKFEISEHNQPTEKLFKNNRELNYKLLKL